LKTRKLLKIRGAQHARNAEKAVRMYTACTRSSEERVASFLAECWG
jgi:plasmid stability protein